MIRAARDVPSIVLDAACRQLWTDATNAINSGDTDNATKLLALQIRDQLRLEADVCVLNEKVKSLEAENKRLKLARLSEQTDVSDYLERGIRGKGKPTDIYPSFVYEARDAIRCRDENIPWLNLLLDALEWKGGTIHDALNCVRRLVAVEKEREAIRRGPVEPGQC